MRYFHNVRHLFGFLYIDVSPKHGDRFYIEQKLIPMEVHRLIGLGAKGPSSWEWSEFPFHLIGKAFLELIPKKKQSTCDFDFQKWCKGLKQILPSWLICGCYTLTHKGRTYLCAEGVANIIRGWFGGSHMSTQNHDAWKKLGKPTCKEFATLLRVQGYDVEFGFRLCSIGSLILNGKLREGVAEQLANCTNCVPPFHYPDVTTGAIEEHRWGEACWFDARAWLAQQCASAKNVVLVVEKSSDDLEPSELYSDVDADSVMGGEEKEVESASAGKCFSSTSDSYATNMASGKKIPKRKLHEAEDAAPMVDVHIHGVQPNRRRVDSDFDAVLHAKRSRCLFTKLYAPMAPEDEAKTKVAQVTERKSEVDARVEAEDETRIGLEEDAKLNAGFPAHCQADEEVMPQAEHETEFRAGRDEQLKLEQNNEDAKEEQGAGEEGDEQEGEQIEASTADFDAVLHEKRSEHPFTKLYARMAAEEEAKIKVAQVTERKSEVDARVKAEDETRIGLEEDPKLKAGFPAQCQADEEVMPQAEHDTEFRAGRDEQLKLEQNNEDAKEEQGHVAVVDNNADKNIDVVADERTTAFERPRILEAVALDDFCVDAPGDLLSKSLPMLDKLVADHSRLDVDGQPVSATMFARIRDRGDVVTLFFFVRRLQEQNLSPHDVLTWFTYMHLCPRRVAVTTILAEIRSADCGCSLSLLQQAYSILVSRFAPSEYPPLLRLVILSNHKLAIAKAKASCDSPHAFVGSPFPDRNRNPWSCKLKLQLELSIRAVIRAVN